MYLIDLLKLSIWIEKCETKIYFKQICVKKCQKGRFENVVTMAAA